MQIMPPAQWERLCAELSSTLQGCAATVETLPSANDALLVAARAPFDGLRLEGEGDTLRILALAGGRALCAVEGPTRLSLSPGNIGEGQSLVIEAEGRPTTRISLAAARRASSSRPRSGIPLHERTVGDAGAS